ncbi:MAG: hypothetical protein B7Y36_03600 [Novosphingobium sp. 28-62-57]|jgi:hypothetical protein|uniref:DUF6961 family protein n=1 Tax=Novosphingobium sp. 28-62-57 TaxID=1970409 RepID=UPI000BD4057A|nr:hypothetical protein [Novosphingobium sp. 28-62-57]OYZ12594.1 MAG: hypothetical protein B7Y36_03600 [Novosphingobium sp. 28-62-57]
MLSDWELWACANQVIKAQGDKAAHYVAEQIGALALAGDAEGIKIWQAIAHRITELSDQVGPTTRQ